jgi:short-subunit dehydrogenase
MDINGKKVILTGASSGIGLELLYMLAEYDCQVIAVARSIEKVEIKHSNVIKFACDISTPENVDALFEFAGQKFGDIDIFICNAGFAYYEEIEKSDWGHIAEIFKTNVFSTIYSSAKMKDLHKDRPYRVVVTASAMSFLALPGYSLYASTKAALHGFATAYRFELKKDQKLQMVYPIGTRTNFFNEAGEDTPVPWPTQTPKQVARAIIKGILKDKKSIFPSRLFLTLNILNGYFPFIKSMIAWFEYLKLCKWRKSKAC